MALDHDGRHGHQRDDEQRDRDDNRAEVFDAIRPICEGLPTMLMGMVIPAAEARRAQWLHAVQCTRKSARAWPRFGRTSDTCFRLQPVAVRTLDALAVGHRVEAGNET